MFGNDSIPPKEKVEKTKVDFFSRFKKKQKVEQPEIEAVKEAPEIVCQPKPVEPSPVNTSRRSTVIVRDWSLYKLGNKLGLLQQNIEDASVFSAQEVPDDEQILFLKSIEIDITKHWHLLQKADEEKEEQPAPDADSPPPPLPVDMKVSLAVSKNGLEAWAFAIPPLFGGKVLTKQQVEDCLRAESIKFGVDISDFYESVSKGNFMQLFVIAKGIAGKNGEDGKVTDRFSKGRQMHLSTSSTDTVDYKNLHWIQNVNEGEVICDLVMPIPPVDGTTVRGVVINKKTGRMPSVPSGTGTAINQEKTALLATHSGHLNYIAGKFRVDKVLRIDGDVDNSVGNLDVVGDLEIKGNVGDDFSVKASGNIIVRGVAEGARLEAGGNVQVILGMKGNSKGQVIAGGNIVCKYLENATAKAKKSVVAENIINGKVSAGESVMVTSGHGVIIGGRISAGNTIEAKVVGNESHRITELIVGTNPAVLEEILELTNELEIKQKEIKEAELNIAYLKRSDHQDKLSQERLSKLKLKLTVNKMTFEKKERQKQALEEQQSNVACQIVASTLFPQTSIEIGGARIIVRTISRMCRAYKGSDGEIEMGTK